jgi:hypothetical protein
MSHGLNLYDAALVEVWRDLMLKPAPVCDERVERRRVRQSDIVRGLVVVERQGPVRVGDV